MHFLTCMCDTRLQHLRR